MSEAHPQELVTRAFMRLRRSGFQLGIGEYRAALQALEGGFGDTTESLMEMLKILWCHSTGEQNQFEPIWRSLLTSLPHPKAEPAPSATSSRADTRPERHDSPLEALSSSSQLPTMEQPPEPEMGSVPVQAPFLPSSDDTTALYRYSPISRRSMVYLWRYLRRPVADGPQDVLDIDATVTQVTHQGFYLAPVYRRRERNQAHLLLLIDQNGSMMPFHRFTRDLAETALMESTLQPENVNTFYFQNVPASTLYTDSYLTEPMSRQEVLSLCTSDTSVLIVSDAGAARGHRTQERIRAVTRFLFQLKRYTSLIAWLNPMPEDRWLGSSAEIIAQMVPMYQMDNTGLSNAVDIVRGQPLRHLHSPFS